jgi:hypothetical protein
MHDDIRGMQAAATAVAMRRARVGARYRYERSCMVTCELISLQLRHGRGRLEGDGGKFRHGKVRGLPPHSAER